MEWLKRILKWEKGKWKPGEILIVTIIVGAILMIAGSSIFEDSGSGHEKVTPMPEVQRNLSYDGDLENRLEEILSQVKGAGKVKVLITYSTSREIVPAANIRRDESETVERDAQGGSRNISQSQYDSTIIYEEEGGVKRPIVLKEINPQVMGVLVIAEGAADPGVRESLSRAVQVVLNVPLNKIQVLEKMKEVNR